MTTPDPAANGPKDFGGYTAQEWGFPAPPPPDPGTLPPGGGGQAVPYFLQFSALVNSVSRTYRYTFDEAMRHSPENARAMWRDIVVKKALKARWVPTAALTWHIEPRDETNPAEQEAREVVTRIVEQIPNFQMFRMQLLHAVFFGRSALELKYDWRHVAGRQCLAVAGYTPVHPDSLRFKRDGTPGILVHATFPGDREVTDYGMAHFLTAAEREQFVIHRHDPEPASFYEGDMAGSVMGVGLRNDLYWFWWLKQQVVALLMNYLERFSNGLTVFYYDAENPKSKAEAEQAAREQFSNVALLYPRWPNSRDTNGVQRLEAGTASPALLQNLATEYFDRVIEQAIVGQTLSSDTAATGLGSGVADLHGETLARIIKYDAVNLQETLQRDLIDVLYRWNCPGVEPGKFTFEVDSPNSQEVLQYAQVLFNMGVALDEGQLYEISQLTKPKPGSGVVTKMAAMQPAAVGDPAEGMPVAGQPGPPGGDPNAPPPDAGPAEPTPPGSGPPAAAPAMAQPVRPSRGLSPFQQRRLAGRLAKLRRPVAAPSARYK